MTKKNIRLNKLVSEGLKDESKGSLYYSSLIKELKRRGVPKSLYEPFVQSQKDELKHRKRLEKLSKRKQ